MAWPTAETEQVDKVSHGCTMFRHEKPGSPTLQILAFETARNMSRLVALYKSLTDEEFLKLRNGPMRSPGVAFLNSTDETYLLSLICQEKLEDLNQIASIVSRLAKNCNGEELNKFETAFRNMKQGAVDVRNLDFNSRHVRKIIEKMEEYASATSLLHSSLVVLNELESSEKKMQRLKTNDCPEIPSDKTNLDLYNDKISFQRKQVRYFRQVSLWSKTFDKCVGLMARIVCTVYARICVVFGPFVPGLVCTMFTITTKNYFRRLHISRSKAFHMKVYPEAEYCLFVKEENHMRKASKSGPIPKASRFKRGPTTRFPSSELSPEAKGLGFLLSGVTATKNNVEANTRRNQRLIQSAPANTVGAAGLALRYANLITMAETYFYSTAIITDDARHLMFEMLPVHMKRKLRVKLRKHWYKEAKEREEQGLAEGWKEALEEIIEWLAPVAHDTLRWQQDRNLEQQKLNAMPSVLLFQTLHFSDLEKTEAAIVQVLIGLSCIYRYENRRKMNGVGYKEPNVTS